MAKKGKPKAGTAASRPGESMIGVLAALMGQVENSRWAPEVDRAQEIAFDAMEAPTRAKRLALARKALAISPLCADAYSILAAEAASLDDGIRLLRQAVEAGEKALGEAAFEQDAGDFWGLIETRPYMRARQALAAALWEQGERDEAVDHYQDLLRLNPNDNQGIRYMLADALLALGRDEPAAALIRRYKGDESAAWTWSGALLAFRRKGDTAAARKELARAVASNPHVADYLLGRKRMPKELPDLIGFGDAEEAAAYVAGAADAWRAAEGSLRWAEATLASSQASAAPAAGAGVGAPAAADRIDDAVLALLLLGLHRGDRSWKSFDWDAMARLHARGLISDPAGQAKSVVFTEEGLRLAQDRYEKLFGEGRVADS